MIDQLTRADFTGLTEGGLAIEHQGSALAFDVVEVRDLPEISPRRAPFAVIIAGPAAPLLPQGIYGLQHPAHGRLDLFIVPIGRDARNARYEIIFN
jgi:hypothetical protein